MNKRDTQERIDQKNDLLLYQLPRVEFVLGSAFHPVEPRPDFVSTLKTRFNDPESIRPFRKLNSRDIILVILMMTSSLILVITFLKLIVDLFSSDRKGSKFS